jgi:tRNA (guanine-N7-)-methyltransferase
VPSDPERLQRLADLFPQPAREVWLEIGFGGGEHLVWQARHHPDIGFIGCEPFEDGVVKLLSAIELEGLKNVRVCADDARPLLRLLPEASIGRAFILFPDPWPKKRHHKRRLVSTTTLADLARIMRAGAELRIATDVGAYASAILRAALASRSFHWMATGPQDWRERTPDWPQTRYEQKAAAEGRRCYYFRFQRV